MINKNMNIYALKGHKVKCETFSAGYDYQQEVAKQYLEVGKEYTVEKTKVDSFHTDVWLEEFPNIKFNSVFFKDVVKQSEEMDKQHPDYRRFFQTNNDLEKQIELQAKNTVGYSAHNRFRETLIKLINREDLLDIEGKIKWGEKYEEQLCIANAMRSANCYNELKTFLQKKKNSPRLCDWDCVHHQEIWDKMIELEKKIFS